MPFKDPVKMKEYMRQRRSAKKVNVNPVNPQRKPVNPNNITEVPGNYEGGYWTGECPNCNEINKVDPGRSFRPVESCDHFQQLQSPGKPSSFMFKTRLTHKSVNPVNPSVNPVKSSYLLSYSRNKYQFVLYHIDSDGKKSLVKSCSKGEKIVLGSVEIELTWGPEMDTIKEVSK